MKIETAAALAVADQFLARPDESGHLFGTLNRTAARAPARNLRISEISGLKSLRKGWMNDANLNSIDGTDEQRSKTPRVVIVGGCI